ncbi:hypothetical protein PIROE2DRAFT_7015 [Piromyces sp. E2]|nr:hypothetical protein PIROE2DRAFT_7015 [Piromyces sp. E2]|eukprot:OUM65859.1 hypothetical protein PIROE2DRAFT_7015 [Piromyces sp. E2]
MKFVNFAILALASVNFVSASPIKEKRAINDKNQCNDQYCYWVSGPSGGTATLVGFGRKNQNSKVVNVPTKVVFEGYTYKVTSVGENAFGNTAITEVNVASGISELKLSHNAFADCKNLKRVVLNSPVVGLVDNTPFSNPNKDCVFLGQGVKTFTNDQVKRLLKSLNIEKKDYSKIDDYQRKVALFELAKTLSQYIRISDNKDGGNVIAAIKTKFGNSAGRARLYRLLAIEMGVPKKDIFIGHDGKNAYFYYLKLDNVWFNCEVDYPFRRYSVYYQAEWQRPFFMDNASMKTNLGTSVNPSSWYVLFSEYGYGDEFRGQQSYDIFDQYLRQNKLGSRK